MISPRQRFKIEALKTPKQDAQQHVYNFNEVSQPNTPEIAMQQAQRCLHRGHTPCSKGCRYATIFPLLSSFF